MKHSCEKIIKIQLCLLELQLEMFGILFYETVHMSNLQQISVRATRRRGSFLLVALRTSGFIDDGIFAQRAIWRHVDTVAASDIIASSC